MTDSQRSLTEVPALLEERRRYETWLVALDARRESTPQHVFERVRADYRARLDRVAEQLASHRQAIEEERNNLQSRLSLLEADESLRRDERAELELRSHVGELVGAEAETAFGTIDQAIAELVEERASLSARIAELQALVADRNEPEPSAPVASPDAPPAVHEVIADAALVAEVEGREAAPATDVAVAVEQAVEPPPPPQVAAAAPPIAPPIAPSVAPPPVPKPAPPAPAVAPPPAETRARGARPSFDEMAFLSSIVGKNEPGAHATAHAATKDAVAAPKVAAPLVERRSSEPLLKAPAGIVQEENAGESLLAGVESAKLATGEHPLAANVSSNTPIVLRPSTTIEQAKTLKCNECGGLNYPTEWYCERCGAELAAL
jgi:hypothetical protein